jgi:hypothetical protein
MNIKILKLRSGEEIACQVLEEGNENIKIFQPMLFKTSSTYDPMGRMVDVTSLHDWLMNTDNKEAVLPSNHVALISEPNKSTMELYKIESTREFSSNSRSVSIKDTEDISMKAPSAEDFGIFIDELIQDINKASAEIEELAEENYPKPKRKKRRNKKSKSYLPPDMVDESELDRHMIMMQLYIPAEAIMNMITSGMLDPQTLLDMVDEVKKRNRFTGDEKKREDFGTKYTDWNPDPNSDDYK